MGTVMHSCSPAKSRGHAVPGPGAAPSTRTHGYMGRHAYLLVRVLFLSCKASSRCCRSTTNLERSSGVLRDQKQVSISRALGGHSVTRPGTGQAPRAICRPAWPGYAHAPQPGSNRSPPLAT